MPKRYRNRDPRKTRPSRKASKLRFIRVKNRCSDPIYNDESGGIYYSQHVRDEIMCWVDIFFPSIYHKGRYFAVALTTLEKSGLEADEDIADKEASLLYPDATIDFNWSKQPPKSAKGNRHYSTTFVYSGGWEEKNALSKKIEEKLNATSRKMRPYINIDRNYWYPAIGFHASLNTPSLSTEVIVDMIKQFREMGEPIKHGNIWTGEEVDVVPQRLIEAYKQRDAESRSNRPEAGADRPSGDQDV